MDGSGAGRQHWVQVYCQRNKHSSGEPQQLSWPPLSGSQWWKMMFPLCPEGRLVKRVQQDHPDAWALALPPQALGHTQQVRVRLPHLDPEEGKDITNRKNTNFNIVTECEGTKWRFTQVSFQGTKVLIDSSVYLV